MVVLGGLLSEEIVCPWNLLSSTEIGSAEPPPKTQQALHTSVISMCPYRTGEVKLLSQQASVTDLGADNESEPGSKNAGDMNQHPMLTLTPTPE